MVMPMTDVKLTPAQRRTEICGVVCVCGPNGEPLACGFSPKHDGDHAWATLPTWTKRWRIVHKPHTDPKRSTMGIEGPPTEGSQIVYGVAMDRGREVIANA